VQDTHTNPHTFHSIRECADCTRMWLRFKFQFGKSRWPGSERSRARDVPQHAPTSCFPTLININDRVLAYSLSVTDMRAVCVANHHTPQNYDPHALSMSPSANEHRSYIYPHIYYASRLVTALRGIGQLVSSLSLIFVDPVSSTLISDRHRFHSRAYISLNHSFTPNSNLVSLFRMWMVLTTYRIINRQRTSQEYCTTDLYSLCAMVEVSQSSSVANR